MDVTKKYATCDKIQIIVSMILSTNYQSQPLNKSMAILQLANVSKAIG